ncbi:MAG: hypothetical protein AAGF12_30415, partial [Myxococcota bacterium]
SDIDVVELCFSGVFLVDPEDVDFWAEKVRQQLAYLARPVEVLLDLGGFRVKPSAAQRFGEVRASLWHDLALATYRFGADGWTATAVRTSSVLHSAEDNLFPSREEALAALLRDREQRD